MEETMTAIQGDTHDRSLQTDGDEIYECVLTIRC